jgi:hypothetical protein
VIPLSLIIVAFLPGAMIFRIPDRGRAKRAALDAEERVFWSVLISAACSSLAVLGLAWVGAYTFGRLLLVDLALAATVLGVWRQRLSFDGQAAPVRWRALYAVALIAIGVWLYFPPAEYIIGGRDPGGYINEGIQIAQRGRLVLIDPVVQKLPAEFRDLFFPSHHVSEYYGLRFMGFFVVDPSVGSVVGQFPHLYPAWVAVGYGIDGLTGARYAVGVWAIAGVIAVYMLASRLLGRSVAFAAALMLAVSLVQVWFARYPNSEMVGQALLFGGLLAFTRAHVDGDGFFAWVAGVLLALLLFLRFDMIVTAAAVFAASVVMVYDRKRIHPAFVATFFVIAIAAAFYMTGPMAPQMARYIGFAKNLRWAHVGVLVLSAISLGAIVLSSRSPRVAALMRARIPTVVSAVTILAAAYAWFLRPSLAGGGLSYDDAAALHTFAWYLPPTAIAAAIIGHSLLTRADFWRDPPFIVTLTLWAFFLFYKPRIIPEHFWFARRFVPIVFPGLLVAIASIVAVQLRSRPRTFGLIRGSIAAALVVVLAWVLVQRMLPIRRHIEYEGLIRRIEALSNQFSDQDLLIAESRNAGSDVHVLATPLAYIYARNVLLLDSPAPNKAQFAQFLEWARKEYRNIYFLGGGGTDLLSRSIGVAAVASDRFQVPEYEQRQDAYPQRSAFKEFEYSVYRFVQSAPDTSSFILDVGIMDDLNVVRFFAKETSNTGVTFRWTQRRSFVSIPGMRPTDTTVTLYLGAGPRPPLAGPARVRVSLNDRELGTIDAAAVITPYSFRIPPEVAALAAQKDDPARLTLETSTWNPQRFTGGPDTRELGVMVDRVEVR